MKVRIYKPAQTAMSSGVAKTKNWILEYERIGGQGPEALMGWNASADTLNQVKLRFESAEAAIEYAVSQEWQYSLAKDHKKRIQPRHYGDNFKFFPDSEKVNT